jgi:hypothetical protein
VLNIKIVNYVKINKKMETGIILFFIIAYLFACYIINSFIFYSTIHFKHSNRKRKCPPDCKENYKECEFMGYYCGRFPMYVNYVKQKEKQREADRLTDTKIIPIAGFIVPMSDCLFRCPFIIEKNIHFCLVKDVEHNLKEVDLNNVCRGCKYNSVEQREVCESVNAQVQA